MCAICPMPMPRCKCGCFCCHLNRTCCEDAPTAMGDMGAHFVSRALTKTTINRHIILRCGSKSGPGDLARGSPSVAMAMMAQTSAVNAGCMRNILS